MTARNRQQGISLVGILVVACLFAFFLTVALRLAPPYMEGRKVRSAISHVAENSDASMSLREINKRVTSTFTTNMIEVVNPKDVRVYREKSKIVIDANYEARVNLFKGIDAVLIFDDITFTVD